jgi:hypothetical protein
MRASWRNLDWVGEADRGQLEKRLAEIGGEGSTLLDRVEFLARAPARPGAPYEVRITGNVAKNQIAAVRRDASPEVAFHAALEAFERSAQSVWKARQNGPGSAAAALQVAQLQAPTQIPRPSLAPRWRPDLSLPRLQLILDRQALFERLAQPTRGAWRAASSRLPHMPSLTLRRALSREGGRNRDRDRAEALERMSWRERLAALAMWNEVEAAERWAREQVFARRWRSEMEQQLQQGEKRREVVPVGWRERLADLSLWNELEAAERWAREQVLTRLGRGDRELPDARAASELPATFGASLDVDLRRVRMLSLTARLFAQISRGLGSARGLVERSADAVSRVLQLPMPVRVGASLGVAAVVGLWSFQGASFTEVATVDGIEVAYGAVAAPESWPRSEAPFSAVAGPIAGDRDAASFSAIAAPGAPFLFSEIAFSAVARSPLVSGDIAPSGEAVPGRAFELDGDPIALNLDAAD